jgi:histone-lysine N-methyltransferase SETMAR
MLTYDLVLLHDNVRPYTAARTRALLKHFNWEMFHHPPYSPDLAPNDYYLFIYLKNWLGPQLLNNNVLIESVKIWMISQAADFSDTGIQKLIPRCDNASILAVTTLRSNINIYVFCIYNTIFSLLVLLAAHRN